jgi:hypothetical protein
MFSLQVHVPVTVLGWEAGPWMLALLTQTFALISFNEV